MIRNKGSAWTHIPLGKLSLAALGKGITRLFVRY